MKLKHIITFFLLLVFALEGASQYSPEQQKVIDSLTNLLDNTTEDTTRISLRFQIGESGWIFRTTYWDSISNDCIKLLAKKAIVQDPNEMKTIEYFDIISWLKSKVEDRSMEEIIREITKDEKLSSGIL